jgi:hypothetical protein
VLHFIDGLFDKGNWLPLHHPIDFFEGVPNDAL